MVYWTLNEGNFMNAEVMGNLAELAQAQRRVLAPAIASIVRVADKMETVYGEFQQALFAVLQKCPSKGQAKGAFDFVEEEVCLHFGKKLYSGNDWDTLKPEEKAKLSPKLNEIGGLASWNMTKSKLLKGYSIEVKLGDKAEVVGNLNPTVEKYAGRDGSRIWLRDIARIQQNAIDEYQEKLKQQTQEKMAAASAQRETGGRNSGPQLMDKAPEIVSVAMTVLTRTVNQALGHKSVKHDEYLKAIAGFIRRAADGIATTMQADIDAQKKASREQVPTPEQARAQLELRRAAGVTSKPIVQVSDSKADDSALPKDLTPEEMDRLDTEAEKAFAQAEALQDADLSEKDALGAGDDDENPLADVDLIPPQVAPDHRASV